MPEGGYDINFGLNNHSGKSHLAAVLEDEASGRVLELRTDQPGLQIYSGAKLGAPYQAFGGLALEPQKFSDAPNHPNFPSIQLEPGETLAGPAPSLRRTGGYYFPEDSLNISWSCFSFFLNSS